MRVLIFLLLATSLAFANSEASKKKIIAEFHEKAKKALKAKRYSEAIAAAETMRTIQLTKDQKHLNQAKQIIDKAKIARSEEFDAFIVEAKERFDQGDYQASKDLCEEMLKKDPYYGVAKDCVTQSEEKMGKRYLNKIKEQKKKK